MTTVTTRAPGRVNLIGEHTDYNGGLCLPFAIPLVTTATVSTRPDDRVVVASEGAGRWEGTLEEIAARTVTGWPAYVAGVVWSLQDSGWAVPGLEITLESTVPLGGGLSSSAALECAVGVAVAALLDQPLDDSGRRFLAEACRRGETEYVGAPTGGLDQLASLLGAEEHAVLVDFGDPATLRAERVPFPLRSAGLAILITDTGVRHELSDGDGGYAQRRAECDAAAAALGVTSLREASIEDVERLAEAGHRSRARHVVTENARVEQSVAAVADGDWAALGALMAASHASLRDDFQVTVPEVDLAVDAAHEGGALGARMTGGGFGGCTIALVSAADDGRAGDVTQVRDSIDAAFAAAGHPRPTHHLVHAAAGALLAT